MCEDFDYIAYDKCDSCGEKVAGAMLHCRGTPVMFLCPRPHCGGRLVFERLASEQKERFLRGSSRDLEQAEVELDQAGIDFRDELAGLPEFEAVLHNVAADLAVNSAFANGGLPEPEPGCDGLEDYFRQLERAS